MTAEEVVAHLLELRPQDRRAALLTLHRFDLSLQVIVLLKGRVDQEKLRNAADALALADLACAIAPHVQEPTADALARWARGNALHHLSRHPEALECYQVAQALGERHRPGLEVSRLQINQVAALQAMGDCQAALELAESARAGCEPFSADGEPFPAILEMNLGSAYQQMGRPADALAAYERGRMTYAALGHAALGHAVGAARFDINRANVLDEMNRFREAEQLLLSARATLERVGYAPEVARADLNLGRLALRRGQYQAALRRLEAASHGFTTSSARSDVAMAVVDLYDIPLQGRPLVYMSACETGRCHPRGGGLLGMGRALLAAGASGLVVSLWKVVDDASARLAADFYRTLVLTSMPDSSGGALQHVQQLAIARQEHPFFWAGLIFIQG